MASHYHSGMKSGLGKQGVKSQGANCNLYQVVRKHNFLKELENNKKFKRY